MSDESTSLPRPHRNSSFSYRTINKTIKSVLDVRSRLDNTVQISMPFIKATTTVDMEAVFGADYRGYQGFTLGIHSTEEDRLYKDLYSSEAGEYLIGYTYDSTGNGRVKNVYTNSIDTEDGLIRLLSDNVGGTLYAGDEGTGQRRGFVPPPGITSAKISRYRDGRVAMAQINFTIPTLPQLEILHRTFLVPGMGTVVEWGQQFAPPILNGISESPLPSDMNFFPWHRPAELQDLFDRLGQKKVGIQEIMENYVYPSKGNYMWMFGEIGNFSVKANGDGSYDCQAKVIGPSEASWAYNVMNTVVPIRNTEREICPKTYSVSEYLTNTSDGNNLKTLLQRVLNGQTLPDWTSHVIKFANGNQLPVGEGNTDPENVSAGTRIPGEDENRTRETTAVNIESFGDDDDAYYMTWRFFVNVVLNDETVGIKSIFKNAGLSDSELEKIGILKPYEDINGLPAYSAGIIDDPYETYVGNNQYLRSIDISTLIIVNEIGATRARNYLEKYADSAELDALFSGGPNGEAIKMAGLGDFYLSGGIESSENGEFDKGLLSTGVWVNHKAVVKTLAASETLLTGISNLLQRMNSSTAGYWNLMIDESPPTKFEGIDSDTDDTSYNYVVVDANYHENSVTAVNNFLNDVYVFNKYIRNKDNVLVGSETIDASVELSLPQTLFSQIATLGLVQQEDLDAARGEESSDSVSIGVNDTLRKMFAITSLSLNTDPQKNPDLTKKLISQREIGTCGGSINNTEMTSTGRGFAVTNQPATFLSRLSSTPPASSDTQIPSTSAFQIGTLPTQTSPSTSQFTIGPTIEAASRIGESPENILDSQLCRECISTQPPTSASAYSPVIDNRFGIPMRPPLEGQNTQSGGDAGKFAAPRGDRTHSGVDIRASVGTPLYATHAGTIIEVGTNRNSTAGLYVKIRAANGVSSRYIHMDRIDVRLNQQVTIGQQIGTTGDSGRKDDGSGYAPHLHFELYDANGTAVDPIHLYNTNPAPPGIPSAFQVQYRDTAECAPCRTAQRQIEQVRQETQRVSNAVDRALRKFNNLSGTLRWHEIMPDIMVSRIARDSNGIKSNAFGAAPGTLSIKANLTLPGIAGLRVGELFWIDRIPLFYRAFGAFQIMTVEDDISLQGWTTKIDSRFNYLGGGWKSAVVKILQEQPSVGQ